MVTNKAGEILKTSGPEKRVMGGNVFSTAHKSGNNVLSTSATLTEWIHVEKCFNL